MSDSKCNLSALCSFSSALWRWREWPWLDLQHRWGRAGQDRDARLAADGTIHSCNQRQQVCNHLLFTTKQQEPFVSQIWNIQKLVCRFPSPGSFTFTWWRTSSYTRRSGIRQRPFCAAFRASSTVIGCSCSPDRNCRNSFPATRRISTSMTSGQWGYQGRRLLMWESRLQGGVCFYMNQVFGVFCFLVILPNVMQLYWQLLGLQPRISNHSSIYEFTCAF